MAVTTRSLKGGRWVAKLSAVALAAGSVRPSHITTAIATVASAAAIAITPVLPATTATATDCTVSATGAADGYTDPGGTHYGIEVTIYWNPCYRRVRARAHCQGFPSGTYYVYGDEATSTGYSAAYCGGTRYGKQGWEDYYDGSWHFHESFNY